MTARSLLGCSLAACLGLLAGPGAALAEDGNPFVPPSQREADREAQIQQRVDKAVDDLEGRIMQSLVNTLEGKAPAGAKEAPLAEALKKLGAASAPPPPQQQQQQRPLADALSLPAADRGGGFPPLPPLPGSSGQRGAPVPAGSLFVGCLDRKAFFQDPSGSPFLVDPAAFPASAAGPGGCGR